MSHTFTEYAIQRTVVDTINEIALELECDPEVLMSELAFWDLLKRGARGGYNLGRKIGGGIGGTIGAGVGGGIGGAIGGTGGSMGAITSDDERTIPRGRQGAEFGGGLGAAGAEGGYSLGSKLLGVPAGIAAGAVGGGVGAIGGGVKDLYHGAKAGLGKLWQGAKGSLSAAGTGAMSVADKYNRWTQGAQGNVAQKISSLAQDLQSMGVRPDQVNTAVQQIQQIVDRIVANKKAFQGVNFNRVPSRRQVPQQQQPAA